MESASKDKNTRKPVGRLVRKVIGALLIVFVLLVLTALGAAWWLRGRVQANLPQLEGESRLNGLLAPVSVERDALGIPWIRAEHRRDVALATGFLHSQDRFFQMDLVRRRAAGELSELLGRPLLGVDKAVRIHRFQAHAERVFQTFSSDVRELLESYCAGVNQGLRSQGKPFEYAVLRQEPRPWQPKDTVLVLLSMFARLQDINGFQENQLSLMHEVLPPELFEFLVPWGTEWDAPLVGEAWKQPPIPGPEVLDLRASAPSLPKAASVPDRRPFFEASPGLVAAGSNSWAVSGAHTADGEALLANELHLPLAVPNIWYRASFSWPAATDPGKEHRVTGLTLPGAPAMVVGSNGHVAWGVTNSQVDTSDIILLEADPQDESRYLTPEGSQAFERHVERIALRDGGAEELVVETTLWGPVTGESHHGRRLVVRSVVDQPEAVDFEILRLETARDLDEALAIARRSGVPALNFTVADAAGRIAWTIIGRMPRRVGFDGRLWGSWAGGERRWQGLLAPEEVPRVVDPESGRIWTANNRIVDGEMLTRLGSDGFGYVLGARARQIRDGLFTREKLTAEDMREIQLDDRGLFLERWRDLVLQVLTPEALAADPRRREFRSLSESWDGRASVDAVGYRLARSFRIQVGRIVFPALTAGCKELVPGFDYFFNFRQVEGPLWSLLTHRPAHLLDPRHESWDDLLLSAIDRSLGYFSQDGKPLSEQTWGRLNTSRIQHPFSLAAPFAGRWLDMPRLELPGDRYMPRVQNPSYGATLRMVVSPGHEEAGYLHTPGGQSGNPLSPHYEDGHAAWAEGRPTPLLPQSTVHLLKLLPAEERETNTEREAPHG